MNKIFFLKKLNNIATLLDFKSKFHESNIVTDVMIKLSQKTPLKKHPKYDKFKFSDSVSFIDRFRSKLPDLLWKRLDLYKAIDELLIEVRTIMDEKSTATSLSVNYDIYNQEPDDDRRAPDFSTGKKRSDFYYNLTPQTAKKILYTYNPTNLPEFRDFLYAFYKDELNFWSEYDSLKPYLSKLKNNIDKIASLINNYLLDKPLPKICDKCGYIFSNLGPLDNVGSTIGSLKCRKCGNILKN